MPYLLGLDVGTTNTKAVLYDLDGRVRSHPESHTVGRHLQQHFR